MKILGQLSSRVLLLMFSLFLTFNIYSQNVGINATGATPDNSALLDLSSTDKGFLITRVDTADIASPAFGLMTLAPIDSCLYMYSGVAWKSIGGVGSGCSCNSLSIEPPELIFPCDGTVIPVVEVTSTTGEVWMDRNLGASQVATSSTDSDAYGDLYQWGRCSDGHEKRNSGTTTTESSADTPGHGNYIRPSPSPYDWRDPQNDNLWQGVSGVNNPCPTGYRLPTEAEFDSERISWSSNDPDGAFYSPLKLTVAGRRNYTDGLLSTVGSHAYYWTSSVDGSKARILMFYTNYAGMFTYERAAGFPVRCIKD